jgi:hypothetical protein
MRPLIFYLWACAFWLGSGPPGDSATSSRAAVNAAGEQRVALPSAAHAGRSASAQRGPAARSAEVPGDVPNPSGQSQTLTDDEMHQLSKLGLCVFEHSSAIDEVLSKGVPVEGPLTQIGRAPLE